MSLKVTGKITNVLEKQSGTSKSGNDWVKQSFVLNTEEKYNNIYCFEVFGDEKVENLNKYNKVGDVVEVEFNVSTNEWQGKYFTSLQAWKISKSNSDTPPLPQTEAPDLNDDDDLLPF